MNMIHPVRLTICQVLHPMLSRVEKSLSQGPGETQPSPVYLTVHMSDTVQRADAALSGARCRLSPLNINNKNRSAGPNTPLFITATKSHTFNLYRKVTHSSKVRYLPYRSKRAVPAPHQPTTMYHYPSTSYRTCLTSPLPRTYTKPLPKTRYKQSHTIPTSPNTPATTPFNKDHQHILPPHPRKLSKNSCNHSKQ